ncbi:zinc finger, C2H2 type family protein (macronuclear) [Tetrahymena thermophila SB210]|uniref:Zinc finger, C2H2 type family protein n=1 Tax=Tetrahymena thermophila (strain SB210) TaxID=312017 RepID=I7M665_TETTS|nr:zinc finger, C2H2 type family protein [Tetrahymena thermophila SB210]EAR84440.2 zinc finger, C2H2 type family protein [Tetrahymena thermophila SB210]|eukprot:XP_001032103.2 zinc finger, C2H2 type family protein [Tetrahymena thermophila SB210]
MKKDNQQKQRADKNQKVEKQLNWWCKYSNCGKKYSLESSLFNHIRIKHPECQRKSLVFNKLEREPGRPMTKKQNSKTDNNEELIIENSSKAEIILGFYKSKLWQLFCLEFKNEFGEAISNIESGIYEQIKSFVNDLEAYYFDISYPQTQKEKDDFFQQLNMFSYNLKEDVKFNICKAIVLFYLMNTSQEFQYQIGFIDHLITKQSKIWQLQIIIKRIYRNLQNPFYNQKFFLNQLINIIQNSNIQNSIQKMKYPIDTRIYNANSYMSQNQWRTRHINSNETNQQQLKNINVFSLFLICQNQINIE